MHRGEEAGRVLDEACEDKLEPSLIVLGRDTEGLRAPPQPRPCLSDGDVEHSAEPNACCHRNNHKRTAEKLTLRCSTLRREAGTLQQLLRNVFVFALVLRVPHTYRRTKRADIFLRITTRVYKGIEQAHAYIRGKVYPYQKYAHPSLQGWCGGSYSPSKLCVPSDERMHADRMAGHVWYTTSPIASKSTTSIHGSWVRRLFSFQVLAVFLTE